MHSSMQLRRALPVVVAFAACRSTPPPAPVATPTAAPAPVMTPVADVDAAAPATDPRRAALVAAWRADNPQEIGDVTVRGEPVDVPDPSAPGARAAGVVMHGTDARLVLTAVPFVAGSQATAGLSYELAPEAITGVSARDLNGDQRLDLAVFVREEPVLDDYLPLQRFARFFALHTNAAPLLAPMVRAEVQLLGVRDDDALAAALPTMNTYEPPAAGMSPVRFLARLRYATPAQFRAAVASTGLRLCTDLPDRTGNRRRRCATTPVARLTDALITGRIRRDLGVFDEVQTDEAGELTMPSCQRQGAEIRCRANIGGPAGVHWALLGEGETLRLIEVCPWAESS